VVAVALLITTLLLYQGRQERQGKETLVVMLQHMPQVQTLVLEVVAVNLLLAQMVLVVQAVTVVQEKQTQ
tara:strand:- start:270 stop:479 length:210 start_codon:yes stop_codon:yes gene_type:complete